MEDEILPWARETLGPLKGGSDRVTCETCHGRRPATRDWRMPAVAALPQPDVKVRGWEQYGGPMDAQMRKRQSMGILPNPASRRRPRTCVKSSCLGWRACFIDRRRFTRPYEFKRSRLAFGCYPLPSGETSRPVSPVFGTA